MAKKKTKRKRKAIGALAVMQQKYNALPTPVQYLVLAGGVVVGYKIYKAIVKTDQEKSNAQIANETKKELDEYLKNTKLTYAASQYPAFANQIYEGTKYGLGDNYPLVSKVMQLMKNNADVAKLIQAYGARQNYIFGIPAGEPKDLFTNIRTELGSNFGFFSGHLDAINTDWAKKGIKYKI